MEKLVIIIIAILAALTLIVSLFCCFQSYYIYKIVYLEKQKKAQIVELYPPVHEAYNL